jgi:Inner centromere protein, ARK binding region
MIEQMRAKNEADNAKLTVFKNSPASKYSSKSASKTGSAVRMTAKDRARYLDSQKMANGIVPEPDFDSYDLTDTEEYNSDASAASARRKEKRIPRWARSENLEKLVKKQFSPSFAVDPFELFGQVETCDLKAMFKEVRRKKKEKKVVKEEVRTYHRSRKSSGDWSKYQITDEEKRQYKIVQRQYMAEAWKVF